MGVHIDVTNYCKNHKHYNSIIEFNNMLIDKGVNKSTVKYFAASISCFNFYIAAGICGLSGRVFNHISDVKKHDSLKLSSQILDAAVDEHGLKEGEPLDHHSLYVSFCEAIGVSEKELFNDEYIVPAAKKIGIEMKDWYWNSSVGFSIGVHLASELTSQEEFNGWNKYFPDAFDLQGDALNYIKTHVIHEDVHVHSVDDFVRRYLEIKPEDLDDIINGASCYLESYIYDV